MVQISFKERRKSVNERALYKLVVKYFRGQDYECYTDRELQSRRRNQRGLYLEEEYPIPDVVARKSSQIVTVEIKGDTDPKSIWDCIGKITLMLLFSNKVYAAFPANIPDRITTMLKKVIPNIGLLEVDIEQETVAERIAAPDIAPTDIRAWRRFWLELDRVVPRREYWERKIFELPKTLITDVDYSEEERLVRVRIDDPLLDDRATKERIERMASRIDSEIFERGLNEVFGTDTRVVLDSEVFSLCECGHVMTGYGCSNCGTKSAEPNDSDS
jgi:hypothetical protein